LFAQLIAFAQKSRDIGTNIPTSRLL